MGAYIYTLKGPKNNIKVNINGGVFEVALLVLSHKPISSFFGEKEPRWQILANARITRMENVWSRRGFPKYVVHVHEEKNKSINFVGAQVFEWSVPGASICDESNTYLNRKIIGEIGGQTGKVFYLKKQ